MKALLLITLFAFSTHNALSQEGWELSLNRFLENELKYREKNKSTKVESYYDLDGRLDSIYRAWDTNGLKITEGNYQNGLKNGIWTEWLSESEANDFIKFNYQNNEIKDIYYYSSHHLDKQTKGSEFFIKFHNKGSKTEKLFGFHLNGNIASEIITDFYEEGKYSESIKNWREEGNLKLISNSRNGLPHGLQKEWDEDGNVILEEYYDMGKLVKKVK